MDSFIGRKLDGRYLIEELVGTGGMANVYKAQDLKHNKAVAVKILREEYLSNEDLVRRFKNESKAIAVLDHPCIVKVFDISVTDKLQFIVMEFIDGITLKEYMDRRGSALTYKEVLFFVTQTLDALSHAHEKGVVHRDIKPHNIMLLEDGTIRVMDFGIARFSRAQNAATITDKAIGSVHYISPEQAKGDVTDAKADIYSVGVMMYEMLSGKLPFESDSMVSVAIKQISDTAKPLREIKPDIPKALEAITCKAMAKDPLQRYASAKNMLGDIEEFKKNPSVNFEYQYLTDSTPERYIDKIVRKPKTQAAATQKTKKKRRRYGLPILAGMAVACAIGATILVFMIFKLSGNPLFNDKLDIDLPNFIGNNLSSVKSNNEYSSVFKFVIEEKFNDADSGVIYDQYPKSGKKVKEGAKITLRVSKGFEMVTVPDVVGNEKDTAQKALKDSFYISYRSEITAEVTPGKVTKTEPVAGESVKAGSTIYVYISQTKQETEAAVPELLGTLLEEAKTLLNKYRFTIGTITQEESDSETGTVLKQSPEAGTVLKKGSSVHITIAKPWEERERIVTVNFEESINAATWKAVMNGKESEPFVTKDGVVAIWQFAFSGVGGDQTVIISNSIGDSYNVTLNFKDGVDQSIDIKGTLPPKATKKITVKFDSTVDAGTWAAAMDGVQVSSYSTKAGVADTWTFDIESRGSKSIVVSGPGGSQTISINFAATAANPAAISFGGTTVPPTPTPTPPPPIPSPTATPPVTPPPEPTATA